MAALIEARNKIEGLLSHLEANLNRRLPFKGLLLRRLGSWLSDNLQAVSEAIDKAQADGSATRAIDMLVDLAKDSMPIPALLRPLASPFVRMFFERLRSELHENQDLILDRVGTLVEAPKKLDSVHKTLGQLAREARKLKGY